MSANRIDEAIRLAKDNPAEFEKALARLENEIARNPKEKDALYAEFKDSVNGKIDELKQFSLRKELEPISEIVSLSYIAKRYFSKSRQWLHHRINGDNINGKPASFTQEQLQILQGALKDISKRIGSVNVVHSR